MSITVTPSKQLELDLSEARGGDLLQIYMEDGSSVIATTYGSTYSQSMGLYVDRQHQPVAFHEHVKQEILHLLSAVSRHSMEIWLEKQPPNVELDLYGYLYEKLTSRGPLIGYKVGSELTICPGGVPDSQYLSYMVQSWSFPSRVAQFEPVKPIVGVVEAAKIKAALVPYPLG